MKKLKLMGWLFGLLVAGGLVVLVRWHDEVRAIARAHPDVTFYVLLALILAIPARFIALAAAYSIELLFVGWSRSSLKMLWQPPPSVRLDVLATFIMVMLPQRHMSWLLSFGLLYGVELYTRHVDLNITPILPVWMAQALCVLLVQSCVRYWMHRLEHTIPALWALHKFHHSADRMTILTAARETQFLRGVEAVLVAVPIGLFTAPTAAMPSLGSPIFAIVLVLMVYRTFIVMNGYFCHSNLNTGYGWFGRWLIVSPRMHRLHHAKAPEYYNRNFSNDLVIWDRLFGTYAECDPATDIRTIPVGLNDKAFNQLPTVAGSLREYFVSTYLVFWRELRKGLAAWRPSVTQTASVDGTGPRAELS